MKKQLLTLASVAIFGSASLFAQQKLVNPQGPLSKQGTEQQHFIRCGAPQPGAEWDEQFNKLVAEFVKQHTDATGRVSTVPATIPVVVHIIHNQNSVTQENISAAQVASQITVLNNDFAGTNADITSVPAAFTGVKAGDCQVQFCLATIDNTGNTMAEPGIHRQKWNTIAGATDPNTAADAQTLFDDYIKPATIWDPTKYLNIWVAKMGASGLLGYASWPAASTLTGLGAAETNISSGVVCNVYAFGTSGIAGTAGYGIYNKGRTATHEIGHWLGLRHISGDAVCGNDFCTDTPKQTGGGASQGGLNYGCPTHPWQANTCTSPANSNGEMFMNYMDYCNDACLYMFSADQKTRIQTAMTNGTYRKFLGTHGLCGVAVPAAPVASFSIPATGCTGTAVSVTNNTTGSPAPTYAWTASPSTGVTFSPNATSTAPTITFANTGTYTISVNATNTQGSNSANQTITINNCTLSACDTLMNLDDTSSLVMYTVSAANGGGYVAGNNGYGDTHKGEYHTQAGISGSNVTGVITYFFKNGNNGTGGNATGNLAFELYNGNNTTGPAGTAVRSDNVTLGTIATNGIQSATILAYVHTFSTPYTLTSNEFLSVIKLPTVTGDTAAVYSGLISVPAVNTAWEKYGTAWYTFTANWGGNAALAIFPIVCPASVGLAASELNNKVSIYPNPTSGILNVAYALDTKTDVKIEVTNMLGQVVYTEIEKNATATAKAIDLSAYAKGVYMVTVSTSKDKMVRKVVID